MYQRTRSFVGDILARMSARVATSPANGRPRHLTPLPPTASRATAQSIVDALPDAALVLDRVGRVLAANSAAHDVVGRVLAGEHIARSLRHPDISSAMQQVQDTGQKSAFLLSIKSPSERQLDGTVAPLHSMGEGPDAAALIIVLRDISEREALARMRVEFVANASHELRTPLAALSGFIETLRGPAKDDPAARERFLEIMADQGQRMSRLIDDLLLLSRVEMRAHVAPQGTVDLSLAAAEAIKVVELTAKREGTKITMTSEPVPATIPGDHDELVQAVQNLLSNAVKYGKPGGQIDVKVGRVTERRGGSALKISVTDNGPGIAAEHLPRLTERFYRVDTAASRKKGGTGLGLAIVKHIVVRHRGRIEVASIPGEGATFSLIFADPRNDTGIN